MAFAFGPSHSGGPGSAKRLSDELGMHDDGSISHGSGYRALGPNDLMESGDSLMDSDQGDDESEENKMFVVRVDATRILPNKRTSVEGTVVITNDFFIFEPICGDVKIIAGDGCCHPAAVCVDLGSIQSMNTHISYQELISERNLSGRKDSLSLEKPKDSSQNDVLYLCLRIALTNDSETKQVPTIYQFSAQKIDLVLTALLQCGIGLTSLKRRISTDLQSTFQSSRRFSNSIDFSDWEILEGTDENNVENFVFIGDDLDVPCESNSANSSTRRRFFHRRRKSRGAVLKKGHIGPVEVRLDPTISRCLAELADHRYCIELQGGISEILSKPSMLEELSQALPAHLYGSNLRHVYSTTKHGFSLSSIYRFMKKATLNSAFCLIVIKDTGGTVFGAVLSDCMHPSQSFYGKGDTFVFHWKPAFQKFNWTKRNDFFLLGDTQYFSIGADSGKNAIWFECNLRHGRSEPTETFDNPILCSHEDSAFVIDLLEVWLFVS